MKDRVSDAEQLTDALCRVAAGGTALDPQVIARLLNRNAARGTVSFLTDREREVLALMAEGRSNAAISERPHISDSVVTKHSANIFTRLDLHYPPTTIAESRRAGLRQRLNPATDTTPHPDEAPLPTAWTDPGTRR